jgi:iron complex transport system ATP-binding protein
MLDRGTVVADGKPAEVLTEEGVRRVYHCDVRVHQDPQTGGLSILAAPRLPAGLTGKGIRVHVVAGGGCGEEILRRLSLCGYAVSCGVLNRGDLDTAVAEALGAETALEQPFSSVSREALAAARELASQADAVVLSSVPFGPGNLANLELLEAAHAAGKPVFVMKGIENRDYTPARDAVTRIRNLTDNGAVAWHDVAELLRLLPRGGS